MEPPCPHHAAVEAGRQEPAIGRKGKAVDAVSGYGDGGCPWLAQVDRRYLAAEVYDAAREDDLILIVKI
jgi:hypothetical protein